MRTRLFGMIRNVWAFLWSLVDKPQQRRATILLVYMFVALCCWKCLPQIPEVDPDAPHSLGTFLWGARKMWAAALLFGLGPAAIVKCVFREKLADYGVRLGSWRPAVLSLGIFLPVMVFLGWVSRGDAAFLSVYPMNPCAGWSPGWFALHAVCYLLLYYTAFEFFFRGFLLHGLADTCGVANAVLIQAAVAAFFHFGHPGSELWSSFFGSLLWAFVALRTRGLWAGWLQHATLGIVLDWMISPFGLR